MFRTASALELMWCSKTNNHITEILWTNKAQASECFGIVEHLFLKGLVARSEIVSKAGIRVPTSQLVQTMVNAEMTRLNSCKIAQRFLKSILQQIGGLAGSALDDEDERCVPHLLT